MSIGCHVICVLGMHRSGTSCLAGSLEKAGVFLGAFDTDKKIWTNLKENLTAVNINNRVLQASGGAWDNPPENVIWPNDAVKKARKMVKSYSKYPYWGFKDPRTLLTIEGWKRVVDIKFLRRTRRIDMKFIGIFRHPIPVSRSLWQRNQIPKEQAFKLWEHYNGLLLELYDKLHFPILSFDWNEHQFHEKLNFVLEEWNLHALSKDNSFYKGELRTNDGGYDVDDLPEDIGAIYDKLRQVSQ